MKPSLAEALDEMRAAKSELDEAIRREAKAQEKNAAAFDRTQEARERCAKAQRLLIAEATA